MQRRHHVRQQSFHRHSALFRQSFLIQNLRTPLSALARFLQNFLNTMDLRLPSLNMRPLHSHARKDQATLFWWKGDQRQCCFRTRIPPHAGWFRHYRLGFRHNGQPVFTEWTVRAIGRDFWQAARFSRFQVRHLPACNRQQRAPAGVLSLASSQTIDIDESMRSFVAPGRGSPGAFPGNALPEKPPEKKFTPGPAGSGRQQGL